MNIILFVFSDASTTSSSQIYQSFDAVYSFALAAQLLVDEGRGCWLRPDSSGFMSSSLAQAFHRVQFRGLSNEIRFNSKGNLAPITPTVASIFTPNFPNIEIQESEFGSIAYESLSSALTTLGTFVTLHSFETNDSQTVALIVDPNASLVPASARCYLRLLENASVSVSTEYDGRSGRLLVSCMPGFYSVNWTDPNQPLEMNCRNGQWLMKYPCLPVTYVNDDCFYFGNQRWLSKLFFAITVLSSP
jgi:hypothetical protein